MLVFVYRALKEADVVLLLAARLNWMLHFGKPPRFNPNVKIIQASQCIQCNCRTTVFYGHRMHRYRHIDISEPLSLSFLFLHSKLIAQMLFS